MNNEEWKDGLPGVGAECERKGQGTLDKFQTVKILGYHGYEVAYVYEDEICTSLISDSTFRPIKKRDPQPGEVWLVDGDPCLFQKHDDGYPFVTLDGMNAKSTLCTTKEYAAPNVKSYIARKLMWSTRGSRALAMAVKYAARLDEE